MKNIITTAIFLLLLTPMVYAQGQKPPQENFDQYVAEVYTGEGATQMAPGTAKYSFLKKMYDERIFFVTYTAAEIAGKGYPNLSTIPLFTIYNDSLLRDEVFNINTFNPLKYYFEHHTRTTQVFVLGNTNQVMLIYPQTINQ